MVQEFHVLRCFCCQTFQVQQVKKVNRWSCKLCGEKQSLLKEFGRGSGTDCRRHVQKLNAMRGAMMEEQERNTWKQEEEEREDEREEQRDDQLTQSQVSCWSKYLGTSEEAGPEEGGEEKALMDRQQFHGNNMIDRKRKRRDGWTDRRGQDSCTPEQSNCCSLMRKPVRPSATTRNCSLNRTDLNWTGPPSMNSIDPHSMSTVAVTSWGRFLSSDCQENQREGPTLSGQGQETQMEEPAIGGRSLVDEWEWPAVCGRSQSVGKAASVSCNDIIHQAPPLARPRRLLPVFSMFESGDDFNFDEFLTVKKL